MTAPASDGYFPAAQYKAYPGDGAGFQVSATTRDLEPADPFGEAAPVISTFTPQPGQAVVVVPVVAGRPAVTPLVAPTPRPAVGFPEACVLMVKKAGKFSGRASRTEFWFGTLGYVLAFVLMVVGVNAIENWLFNHYMLTTRLWNFITMAAFAVFGFLSFSQIAVTVRRLHDAGHSGGLWFLHFIPVVGTFILAGLCSQPPSPFGGFYDDPKRPD